MKKSIWFLPILAFSLFTQAQNSTEFIHDQFPDIWKRAKAYTLETARAMPEEHYGYKPTDVQMTFSEQMVHIANNLYWLSCTHILDDKTELEKTDFNVSSKEETIALLESAFDWVQTINENITKEKLNETIRFAGEEMTRERIFHLMRDHNTHHRAQCIIYLRMNGITPPKYRGW